MRRIPSLALLLIVTTLASLGCAAQRQIDRGQAALLANDPVKARHHFTRALEHKPQLSQKPAFAEDYRVARRDAAVVEGRQALRIHQPLDAIERFESALLHHPQWPAAIEGLSQAHADAADVYHQRAIEAADDGRLDLAKSELETALRHVPTHAHAADALASLSKDFEAPSTDFLAANQHAQNQQWDAALAGYRRSIAAYPNFLPARAAVPGTLDDAARDMLDRGRRLLAQKQFDDAETAVLRTADYRPAHPELQPTLGSIDLTRGDDALIRRLPGSALLWFRRAEVHLQPERAAGLDAARAGISTTTQQLRDRHRLAVSLSPESETRPDLAATLSARVEQRLQAREPLALAFSLEGQQVSLRLSDFVLPSATVHSESLLHAYDVHYDVPNPERPRLEHELHRIDRCIDDLCIREQHLERRHRHLHRQHPEGPSCGCTHEVHRVHRQLDQVRRELRDARRDQRRVSHRLLAEPHFITRTRVEHWPYTRSTHKRSARLVVTFTPPQGQPQTFTPRVTDADSTIFPARPDLGLPEDPLHLMTDAELQDELLDRAANRLAHELGRALVQQRVDALTAEAARLQKADPLAAREARVASAVLLSAIDARASKRQLNAMD